MEGILLASYAVVVLGLVVFVVYDILRKKPVRVRGRARLALLAIAAVVMLSGILGLLSGPSSAFLAVFFAANLLLGLSQLVQMIVAQRTGSDGFHTTAT